MVEGIGRPPQSPPNVKYQEMFFKCEYPFEEFYTHCVIILNKTWREMRATRDTWFNSSKNGGKMQGFLSYFDFFQNNFFLIINEFYNTVTLLHVYMYIGKLVEKTTKKGKLAESGIF